MNTSNEAVLAGPAGFQVVGRTSGVSADHPAGTRLPGNMIAAVVAICTLPFLLNLLGVDFGSPSKPIEATGLPIPIDAMFARLSGAFTHTILEWSAFCAALATCILAFSHYRITGNITTPIIGIALFCSGCMDAFHTLAADRLIEAVAANQDLIPFTWAISRVFNALIMLIGVSLFFSRSLEISKSSGRFIVMVSVLFGVTAYGIIHYCATSAALPQTMFPDSLITRPWDVAPLLLFIFAGLYVYPKFYRSQPSLFAHALVISAIPEVIVELHMAFGSTALFDNHFNIAHFLKIFAYLIPFGGLVLDYVQTYKNVELSNDALSAEISERKTAQTSLAHANQRVQEAMEETKQANSDLAQLNSTLQNSNADLERSNRELEQFAYVASHDLREPLRKITNYTQLFAKKFVDESDEKAVRYIGYITDGATRMDHSYS